MQLSMTSEEWNVLQELLEGCLQDLRSEVHRTRSQEFKNELKQKIMVLSRLLSRLQEQKVTETVGC